MIRVEIATLIDAPEIWRIQKEAFEGQAKIYDNYELPPLTQTLDTLMAEFGYKTFYKAEVDAQVVGSVRITIADMEVEVERLIVAPQFQNEGIGTHIMKTVEKIIGEWKIIKLFTGDRSERNIHVYKKLGYEIYAHSRTPDGVGLVHMKKTR